MADAFGNLIRDWRNQRRMSQLDLALAADVSARHISFLETGRSQPSRGMVLALSESLGVPRATRNVLLNAAGFAQAYRARDLDDEDMAPVREAMDWMLERHAPYPAFAFDRHWRLVRLNSVSTALPVLVWRMASASGGPVRLEPSRQVSGRLQSVSRYRTPSA